jgi:hypothetical protein
MADFETTDVTFKDALKEAVVEALTEQRGLLHEIITDALQELALAEALREIEAMEKRGGRKQVFGVVEGEA